MHNQFNLPVILGAYYAEFHPKQGTIIKAQSPRNFLSSSSSTGTTEISQQVKLDVLSDFLIPKPELCGDKILAVTLGSKYKIVGMPIRIEDKKYERNALMFNVGIVVEAAVVDTKVVQSMVKKLARSFEECELRSFFPAEKSKNGNSSKSQEELAAVTETSDEAELSTEQQTCNGNRTTMIETILNIFVSQINRFGECQIAFHSDLIVNFKLSTIHCPPPIINNWDVPMLKRNAASSLNKQENFTLIAVIREIDGITPMNLIAKRADVDIEYAKLAVRHLVYFQYASVVDLFKFSNIYTVASNLLNFSKDKAVQQDCISFVSKTGRFQHPSAMTEDHPSVTISPAKLFRLYSRLKSDKTVKAFCIENNSELKDIDIRRFIYFGLAEKFISRVYHVEDDQHHIKQSLLSKNILTNKYFATQKISNSNNNVNFGLS